MHIPDMILGWFFWNRKIPIWLKVNFNHQNMANSFCLVKNMKNSLRTEGFLKYFFKVILQTYINLKIMNCRAMLLTSATNLQDSTFIRFKDSMRMKILKPINTCYFYIIWSVHQAKAALWYMVKILILKSFML